jgi:hypothetical protein
MSGHVTFGVLGNERALNGKHRAAIRVGCREASSWLDVVRWLVSERSEYSAKSDGCTLRQHQSLTELSQCENANFTHSVY